MPPRHAYWTIIYGGQPTSFRSATRDELVPTFKQIQSRHPDAQLRYFARGKLWYSDEEAQAALIRERMEKQKPRKPREWRPGGAHTDPRDRFKVPRDVKRARFKANLRRDRDAPRPPQARGPRPVRRARPKKRDEE